MTGQGVSRSESEMVQKSCTSGAPTSEAQEFIAVMPGTMRRSGESPRFQPMSRKTSKTKPPIP